MAAGYLTDIPRTADLDQCVCKPPRDRSGLLMTAGRFFRTAPEPEVGGRLADHVLWFVAKDLAEGYCATAAMPPLPFPSGTGNHMMGLSRSVCVRSASALA